jgi:hypothetical protein
MQRRLATDHVAQVGAQGVLEVAMKTGPPS